MTDENDWTRLARYFAGECTPEEAAEIRSWLAENPELQRLADELRPAWDAAATPSTAWDTPASWQRLAARVRARERRAVASLVQPAARGRRRQRWWWNGVAAAAAVIMAVAGGGLLWRVGVNRAVPGMVAHRQTEVRTAATQLTKFQLPDGSRVVLAPGSVLRYDGARYGAPRRELHLEGRAYFEVIHDARRPFFVRTSRLVTEDLGTAFVITDYRGDATTEVVVASGSVAVQDPDVEGTGHPAVLARGELARLDSTGRVTVQRGVDIAIRTAWTEGRLVFADTPVGDVLAELSRWYGLDVRLGDASLATQRFTASYTTQPDSVIVRELATAIGARVEHRGRAIVLSPARTRS